MKKRKRKTKRPVTRNGIAHTATKLARAKVLTAAYKRGYITTRQARVIGKWNQAWYHLNALVKARMLKKTGYDTWVPR